MDELTCKPIGIVHTPHLLAEETPIQAVYARGNRGKAEIYPEFVDGLRDLEGFSHIHLLYWFHKTGPTRLTVKPYLDDVPRGVFATRAPCRPNPIGISLVRLLRIEGNVLDLEDVDLLDGTPLLDIKPHIPRFDYREHVRCGWQDNVNEADARIRGRRQREGKRE